jgi:ankyrin repeat protein
MNIVGDTSPGLHALGYAVLLGYTTIVKLLLDRPDTDPNLVMQGDRSPLMLAAASKSYSEIVKLLLGRGDIDVNRQDDLGRTALCEAARVGCFENVNILLGRDGIDPNLPDHFGQTPLFWACDSQSSSVVNLLLEREDVNPNAKNDDGYNPLARACLLRYAPIVRSLLSRTDIDPNPVINGVSLLTRVIKCVTPHYGREIEYLLRGAGAMLGEEKLLGEEFENVKLEVR